MFGHPNGQSIVGRTAIIFFASIIFSYASFSTGLESEIWNEVPATGDSRWGNHILLRHLGEGDRSEVPDLLNAPTEETKAAVPESSDKLIDDEFTNSRYVDTEAYNEITPYENTLENTEEEPYDSHSSILEDEDFIDPSTLTDMTFGRYESEVFSFEEQTELDAVGHTNVSQCVVGTDAWTGYFTVPLGRYSSTAPRSTVARLPIGQSMIVDMELAADETGASLSQFRMQACVTDYTGEVRLACAESNSSGKITYSEEIELTEEVLLPFVLEVAEIPAISTKLEDEFITPTSAPREEAASSPAAIAYMTCVKLFSLEANNLALPWVVESFEEDLLDENEVPTEDIDVINSDEDASFWSMFAAPFQSIAWLPQQMQKLLLRSGSNERRLEELTFSPIKDIESGVAPTNGAPLIAVASAIVVGFTVLAVAAAGIIRIKRGKGPASNDALDVGDSRRREPDALRPVAAAETLIGGNSTRVNAKLAPPALSIPKGCRAIVVESPSTTAVAHFVRTPRATAWQSVDAAANPVAASSATISSRLVSSAHSGESTNVVGGLSEDE